MREPSRTQAAVLDRPNMMLALFLGGVTFMWANQFIQDAGFMPGDLAGLALASGGGLLLALAGLASDWMLARAGLHRSVRFGLWCGAIFGPYLGMLAYAGWAHPVVSHVAGVAATIAMFSGGYILDRLIESRFWLGATK